MEQVVHTNSTMPTQSAPQQNPQPVMRKVSSGSNKSKALMAFAAVLIVLAGVAVGWKLSGASGGSDKTAGTENVAPGAKKSNTEAGVDSADCKDTAEGVLEEGGIDGEGTHHLVRSADSSKNVYLGSTVVDLQSYVGKKVNVTGQTISGKKAGWLMDVCKIKISE